jgi:hypothetical protein
VTPRRRTQIGDVFAVHASSGEGIVGRVVSTSAIVGPIHSCHLVYLYRPGSPLGREHLLLPPLLTSRAPFSQGYFEFLRSEPLLPGDFFDRHAFRDPEGRLYDEESRPLEGAPGLVGTWRLYEDVPSLDAAILAERARMGSR